MGTAVTLAPEAPGRLRTGLFAAAMIACAAVVPPIAEILGMHAAGSVWNATRSSLPFLSQAGDVLAGAFAGVLIGGVQRLFVGRRGWVLPASAAGVATGLALAVFRPAAVLVAPAAAGLAGIAQTRGAGRWARAQSMATAWAALALALPFPSAVRAAFLVGAGLVAAWGFTAVARPGNTTARLPRQ